MSKPKKVIKLYHYTDSEGIKGIKISRCINASTNTQTDAMMGKGVYLTNVSPSETSLEIAKNNWDIGKQNAEDYINAGRLDYVVEIEIDSDLVKRDTGDRSIYLYDADTLNLEHFPHKIIKRPRE